MKIGLEIHQQLNTGKLFCRCPSALREDSPDVKLRRKLRAVASETGLKDAVSIAEAAKGRESVYEAYSDSTCLVEIDEEPPREINEGSVIAAISVSKALNCRIVPELFTMRKAILDGSCPGGFQRTGIIGTDGHLETNGKRVGIVTLSLEEDAGRIVGEGTYRLDRMGIPLLEITTLPEIESGEEARAVALALGTILRLSGKAVRGLGTIRQDLNVSIEGGERVELKGVQQLDLIPEYVQLERERQENLISLAKKYGKIDCGEIADVTEVFRNTESKVLRGKQVYALAFSGASGLMKEPLNSKVHFGKEVSGYVKVRSRAKGFFHTDELPAYGVSPEEVFALRKFLGCSEKDLVCLVAEEEQALHAVIARVGKIPNGVLKETRKANEDGTTSFLREIAGSSRFYPETDVPPLSLGPLETQAPEIESAKERHAKLLALGVSDQVAKNLILSENYSLFDTAVGLGVRPALAATIVEEILPSLRRKGVKIDLLSDDSYLRLFKAVSNSSIHREGIDKAIEILVSGGELPENHTVNEEEISREIDSLISEKREYIHAQKGRAISGIMGLAMAKFRGKYPGNLLKEIVERKLANLS